MPNRISGNPPSINGNIRLVAIAFRLVGGVVSLLSVLFLADLADTAYVMKSVPPPDKGPPLDIGTYGLVGLLANGARGVDKVFYALGGVGSWLLGVFAAAAFLALLFGVLLYLVGRGIRHRARWARVAGVLLTIVFALVPCLALAASGRNGMFVAALPILMSFYVLWVLVWRYA